jgi:pyruvate kinase
LRFWKGRLKTVVGSGIQRGRDPCRERKNVNLPGVVVDLPTLTKKDEEDLVNWGLPNDIDFIAASFVRKGQDLDNIRKVLLLRQPIHQRTRRWN